MSMGWRKQTMKRWIWGTALCVYVLGLIVFGPALITTIQQASYGEFFAGIAIVTFWAVFVTMILYIALHDILKTNPNK